MNYLIFANIVTLCIGLYVTNDQFVYLSVGGLLTCMILKVIGGKL